MKLMNKFIAIIHELARATVNYFEYFFVQFVIIVVFLPGESKFSIYSQTSTVKAQI